MALRSHRFQSSTFGVSTADEILVTFVQFPDTVGQKSLFFFMPLRLLLRVISNICEKVIVKYKAIPSDLATVCHDLKVSDFKHPSTEVCAELEIMRFTPKNSIGFLHDILSLSPVTEKRQNIGV